MLSAIRVVSSAYLEVTDISPGNFDSKLCLIQPGISHDVLTLHRQHSYYREGTLFDFNILFNIHTTSSITNIIK